MDARPGQPRLHVEGDDDRHSLIHLLLRNGVARGTENWPHFESPKGGGGVESLLKSMETAIRSGTNLTLGFVLDADSPLIDRWLQVHQRLSKVEVPAPADRPPAEGFIGESTRYKTRVGVWLMPDNEQDGKLEDFLTTLIRDGDPLIGHAQASTEYARTLGATFSIPDTIKAVVHSWLAWQDEPGKPYGQAVQARYFQHDSAVAAKFVAWFKALYRLD